MAAITKPISSATSSNKFRGCAVAFSMVFVVAGVGIIIWGFLRPIYRVQTARNWQATACTILSSKVDESSDSDGTTYRADIHYQYTVSGRQYRSDRVTFLGKVSSSGYESKAKRVAAYPAGSTRTCYVNPANPADAVLLREITSDVWFIGGFGAVFAAGGLLFTWAAARMGRVASPKSDGPLSSSGKRSAMVSTAVQRPRSAELRPATSRFTKVLVLGFFTLFWNGMSWSFLWFAALDRGRNVNLCPTIFLSLFCLIGLVLVGALIHTFLSLANPIPVLTLSPSSIPLGTAATLQWRFTGRFDRIANLRISLQGEERATYRQGTTTKTDTHVFHNQELLNTPRQVQIAQGKLTRTIPSDTMHSFAASNNKIIWRIRVRGEIPRWPDVFEDFDIDVRPMDQVAVPASATPEEQP